jgi:hypothetical protein
VNPLTTFVRSLGNDGAVANAGAVLEARRREEWLVEALERRVGRDDLPPQSVPRAESPAA